MPVNFIELFGLRSNYTKEELKNALMKKIDMVEKLNILPIDKKFLLEQYYDQYNIAKYRFEMDNNFKIFSPQNYFNEINKQHSEMLKQFNSIQRQFVLPENSISSNPSNASHSNSNVYSKAYSYQSSLNPDGTRTVLESTNNYSNGKSDKKIKSYIIDSEGNKKPIDPNQVKKYLK